MFEEVVNLSAAEEAAEEQQSAAGEESSTNESQESATGEEQNGDETNGEGAEREKPKGGFQRRIDKLSKKAADEAREKEYWRNIALRNQSGDKGEERRETPAAATAEPKEDDFETHAEYVKAVAKHAAAEAVKADRAERQKDAAKTQQQKAAQTFQEREEAFKAKTPDFDEVLEEADFQVSRALIAEIVESEHGPELKYYLAKHPDEAAELSKLGPVALARAVGRIESRFTAAPAEKKPVKTSQAPNPPTPVGKGGSGGGGNKDPGEMSPAEYTAWRAKKK